MFVGPFSHVGAGFSRPLFVGAAFSYVEAGFSRPSCIEPGFSRPSPMWPHRKCQRRSDRLGVVQSDQLALFLLEIRHACFSQRLERGGKPRSRPPRALRNTALLPTIARQEDDDAIRLTELIRPENQCVGGVQRHE